VDDSDLLQRHQPAADHFVEHRRNVLFFLAVHDLDDERQVHREPEDFGRVQPAGLAEAIGPRSTVAPARCISRAFKTMAS